MLMTVERRISNWISPFVFFGFPATESTKMEREGKSLTYSSYQ